MTVLLRCLAVPEDEFMAGLPRFREHTAALKEAYDADTLWNVFGVNDDVTVRFYPAR